MKGKYNFDSNLSRRNFLSGAAALAACAMVPKYVLGSEGRTTPDKPNSVFDGVRIGVITYSFHGVETTAEETLDALVKCGASEVELMSGPVDNYVGLGGGPRSFSSAEELQRYREEQPKKRLAVPIEKYQELRRMYNDAGVNIHIVKFDAIGGETSEEMIDKYFEAAKALGAMAITLERSDEVAKRLAPYADKHKIWLAFHNHTRNYPQMGTQDDPILSYGKYIGFNFDTGHYVAGSGLSPIPVIERYHDRIISLHLKDRTTPQNGAQNLPWGQGDTPIKEMLRLIRDNGWTFPADVELEYEVPQDSDSVTEVKKCIEFCKDALAMDTSSETVERLLEKYAANQDNIKSFIAKADNTIESSEITTTSQCEFRTDGDRVNHRSTVKGSATPDQTSYSSFLWDGESVIRYERGTVYISNIELGKKRLIATGYKGAALLGICNDDYDRIDTILRRAKNATLLPRAEQVGDSQCYIIEAKADDDSYKVYIDPQHGYNIAKIEIQRGDDADITSFILENVVFEQINDFWIPMEADIRQSEDERIVKWHHKRTQMTLNPDHEALDSFTADDIPDGTKVNMLGQFATQYISGCVTIIRKTFQ